MTQPNNGNKTTPLNLLIVGELKEEWKQAHNMRNQMYAQAFAAIVRTVKELAEMVVRLVKKGAGHNRNVIPVNR